jgi:hypothetical protein
MHTATDVDENVCRAIYQWDMSSDESIPLPLPTTSDAYGRIALCRISRSSGEVMRYEIDRPLRNCSRHVDAVKLVASDIGLSDILAKRVQEECGTRQADVLSNEWRSSYNRKYLGGFDLGLDFIVTWNVKYN